MIVYTLGFESKMSSAEGAVFGKLQAISDIGPLWQS